MYAPIVLEDGAEYVRILDALHNAAEWPRHIVVPAAPTPGGIEFRLIEAAVSEGFTLTTITEGREVVYGVEFGPVPDPDTTPIERPLIPSDIAVETWPRTARPWWQRRWGRA